MAKARPLNSMAQTENRLRYEIGAPSYPDEGVKRFYSNIRPVLYSIWERVLEEYDFRTAGHSSAYRDHCVR